jgi:hypothetical protein
MEPKIISTDSLGASLSDGRGRNWVPLAVAAALVIAVVVTALVMDGHKKPAVETGANSTGPDPYSASLPITNLTMSESSNLAGGKVTYIDGHIANMGNRIVTGVVVEVTFRDYANKVAQSQRMPLTLIRMREPYIDTGEMAATPMQPGTQQDFRLNIDAVSPDWAGALPEVAIARVNFK